MSEKLKKILAQIESDGLGNEFIIRGSWAVAAEEWPNDEGHGSYFQYYLLFEGDIEITTTNRQQFIKYIEKLM